jgi:hypothetical protein
VGYARSTAAKADAVAMGLIMPLSTSCTFSGRAIATQIKAQTVTMTTVVKTSGSLRNWATRSKPSCTPSRRGEPRRCTIDTTVNAMSGGNGTKMRTRWPRL